MLRSIPNVHVIRPCDERETYAAWRNALLSTKTPTAIITSRQNLPLISTSDADGLDKGAYLISKEQANAQFEIIATGSEVSLAIDAQKLLLEKGIDTRVISMPSWELFDEQSEEYQNSVLTLPWDKRISVEMLTTFGWKKYAKHNMGIDTFGASAPAKDVIAKFNFTPETLVNRIENLLK
jgi:transketolase